MHSTHREKILCPNSPWAQCKFTILDNDFVRYNLFCEANWIKPREVTVEELRPFMNIRFRYQESPELANLSTVPSNLLLFEKSSLKNLVLRFVFQFTTNSGMMRKLMKQRV